MSNDLTPAEADRAKLVDRPLIGEKSTCGLCGRMVMFNGDYWNHLDQKYRHPATPRKYRIKERSK